MKLTKLILIVSITWIILAIILWLFFQDWNKSAAFGDSFGFVNSIFSAFAFAAIIYTVYLQKNELKLQRKELKFTRIELSRTADTHEANLKMFNEQLRINSLPIFEFYSGKDNNKNCIIIENSENQTAFDVDVWLYKPVNKKTISVNSFIDNFVKPNKLKAIDINKLNDKDVFYLSERGVYHSFQTDKSITIPINYLPFSKEENEYENLCFLFFQYRDALNNNYIQTIEFKRTGNENYPYEYSIFKPKIPIVEKRVELIEYFRTENNPEIAEKFLIIEDNSIASSSMSEEKALSVEGKWKLT